MKSKFNEDNEAVNLKTQLEVANETARGEIDIAKVYAIFKAEWKISLYIVTSFLIVGLVYALTATQWYKAEVKIMPNLNQSEKMLSQYSNLAALAGINMATEMGSDYFLYPDIIKSNFVLDKVLTNQYKTKLYPEKVDLFKFLAIEVDSTEVDWKYKLYEKAKKKLRSEYITSFLNDETDLLHIQISVPKDPVLAAELANYIIEVLDIYNKKVRHYKAKDQRVFIEKNLAEINYNLVGAESKLKIFLNNNKDLNSPSTKLEYEKLSSELNLQRSLYLEIKKQLELTRIQEVRETETLNILDRAVIPIEKSRPKRMLIMIVALILGIMFSTAFVIIKSYYLHFKNQAK